MHASNHCGGTIPSLNELLNKIVRGVHKISDRLYKLELSLGQNCTEDQ